MTDKKIIGGVTYFVKDIESVNVMQDVYLVALKDGTMISYKEQPSDRFAEIIINDDKSVDFKGLFEANISDTSEDDVYRLFGCEKVTLQSDASLFDDSETEDYDQDFIVLDNRILADGSIQYSKGNKLYLDKNDCYKLPNNKNVNRTLFNALEVGD